MIMRKRQSVGSNQQISPPNSARRSTQRLIWAQVQQTASVHRTTQALTGTNFRGFLVSSTSLLLRVAIDNGESKCQAGAYSLLLPTVKRLETLVGTMLCSVGLAHIFSLAAIARRILFTQRSNLWACGTPNRRSSKEQRHAGASEPQHNPIDYLQAFFNDSRWSHTYAADVHKTRAHRVAEKEVQHQTLERTVLYDHVNPSVELLERSGLGDMVRTPAAAQRTRVTRSVSSDKRRAPPETHEVHRVQAKPPAAGARTERKSPPAGAGPPVNSVPSLVIPKMHDDVIGIAIDLASSGRNSIEPRWLGRR